MTAILSKLAKAAYLLDNSQEMPRLVRAACAAVEYPYRREVLEYVCTREAVVDYLQMSEDQVIDDRLREMAGSAKEAGVLDSAIIEHVSKYVENHPTIENAPPIS